MSSQTPAVEPQSSDLDAFIKFHIAATNGVHYKHLDKVQSYPTFELPVKPAKKENALMLDIGCGWGRWLVAGSKKNYIPIGLDVQPKFAKAALGLMKKENIKGYVVAADLQEIPFKDNVFDLVWSFSVIQHVHKKRLVKGLHEINRVLEKDGYTKLEFPNLNGLRNRRGPVQQEQPYWDDFNHWCVRYYSLDEYRQLFMDAFKNFDYSIHSILGIGVLKDDLKYVSFKNRLKVGTVLAMTAVSKLIPGAANYADSLYLSSRKSDRNAEFCYELSEFFYNHYKKPYDPLNILPLLKCPITGMNVNLSPDRLNIVSEGGYIYPVEDGIPIMLRDKARVWTQPVREPATL